MISSKFPSPPAAKRGKLPALACSGLALALLAGCAQMPQGPMVAIMPPPNKPFEVFVQEDRYCRDWAKQSIGASDAPGEAMAASTIAGTVIGAVIGAAANGRAGEGAAVGAVIGATSGSGKGAYTAHRAQRSYDIAYQQCMVSKGNLGPEYRTASLHQATAKPPVHWQPPPQPAGALPPPPPGSPPPPPPQN